METTPCGGGVRVRLHGSALGFACAPGQTLLAAGLAAGLDLPYECASGSCGSCRARLLQGRVRSRWHAAPGLSERDRAKGDRVLCCQSEAVEDCVLQLRAGTDPVPVLPERRSACVTLRRRLNKDVLHLALCTDGERAAEFRPGQFMLFQGPGDIGRRAYSMANLPGAGPRLEFLIKRKPGGAASDWLFDGLRTGDSVELEGPYGKAWLRDDTVDSELLLLAGGSGLAPVWSIAQASLAALPQRRVRLYFGVQSAQDLFWIEEMQRLAAAVPTFELVIALARPSAADPPGCRVGQVGDVLAADLPPQSEQSLYMAGPPGLIDHVSALLVRTGRLRAERVFYDRYA